MGELFARKYLTQQGLVYIDRHVRVGRAEIDLIMYHQPHLVFVEVKTRTQREDSLIDWTEEMVSYEQQQRLIQAAHGYLKHHRFPPNLLFRFDWIACQMAESTISLKAWKQNVWS